MGAFEYLAGIVGLASMIWIIYDVITNQKKMDTTPKVLWIVAAVLFSVVTAIVYYFAVKKKSR